MSLKILVLEDEQLAGEKLLHYIKKQAPQAEIAWHRSVEDGVAYLQEQLDLDLIFSDIELLDGHSFKIYETVTPPCPIIFCTAFNHYYIDAFQTNGIAYLLKPYTLAQFQEAWQKYERLFAKQVSPIDNLLQQLQSNLLNTKTHKTTFTIKKREGVFLLKTADIAYFQANGDFVQAFDTKNQKHIINQTLSAIEAQLDTSAFFRINRSEILAKNQILKYESYTKNRLAISLKSQTSHYTSNSKSGAFKKWLEA